MGSLQVLVTGLALLQILVIGANAEIRRTSIEGDSRAVIQFQSFGFTDAGFVDISVTDVSYKSSEEDEDEDDAGAMDPSLMGFFLVTRQKWLQILKEYFQNRDDDDEEEDEERQQLPCVVQNPLVNRLFTVADLEPATRSFNGTFRAPSADDYFLMLGNCLPHVKLRLRVRTAMYNLGSHGNRDYLSVGQTPLPRLYLALFMLYPVLLLVWCYVCLKSKDKGSLHRIHVLMALLLLAKALDLLCQAEDMSHIRRTGSAHGWDIAFYLFSCVKGIMLFAVIVLIGSGWSLLRPHLQSREKRVLMLVIPLQLLANVAAAVVGESGPERRDWISWTQLLLLVDVVCCCAVLFPLIWSIKHLKEAAQSDGKAAQSLQKLSLFRQYYVVVVAYIYLTRVVVFAMASIVIYRYSWLSQLATEMVTLAFYVVTGYKFRPQARNPYFRLDYNEDEDEDATVEDALNKDAFDL